jgi:hypothetical protein
MKCPTPLRSPKHKAKLKRQNKRENTNNDVIWTPFPNSPQEFAFHHPADELFYGGAAGSGKTDLILGLAAYAKHSLLLRREFPRCRAIIERSREIFARNISIHAKDSYNESLHLWRLSESNTIQIGSVQYEQDWQKYQGQAHDLKCWDELTEFSEMQFRKINIWNRHPDPNVRCRIVATGNPPTTVDGEWVLDYWGAFIDPDYDGDRAEQGSLVWFVRKYIGEEDQDVEIARTPLSEVKEYMARGEMPSRPIHEYTLPNGTVKRLEGRSRSFIGGKVEDNPVLMAKGYDKTLEALPIELRTRFREGNFIRIVESTDLQVIPTAWIVAAMDRWIAYMGTKSLDYGNAISIYRTKNQVPNMSAMGVDPSRGGDDETAIAVRFADWIAPLRLTKGKYVEDGDAVRDIIHNLRIGNPQINIDVVGVGSSPYDSCKKMGWSVVAINGGASATDRNNKPLTDRTGLLRFRDINAMLAWKLMEALDPQYNPTLMLPPDPKLKAELCSIRRSSIDGGVVSIESKKEVKKRLGRSPDRADAVKYALLQTISMYAPNPKSQAAALGKVSEWG